MSNSADQYSLRWNHYRNNLLQTFQTLLQTEAFTDVTLACDGSSVKCHKMILAASSTYFQNLFAQNSHQHPIIILKDIRMDELQQLLTFIYTGEVRVEQNNLKNLLKLAENLQVKGLVDEAKYNAWINSHRHNYPPESGSRNEAINVCEPIQSDITGLSPGPPINQMSIPKPLQPEENVTKPAPPKANKPLGIPNALETSVNRDHPPPLSSEFSATHSDVLRSSIGPRWFHQNQTMPPLISLDKDFVSIFKTYVKSILRQPLLPP